jgi:hypothetical protein
MEKIKIIKDILGESSTRLRESFFSKNHPDILEEVNNWTSNIEGISFKERLWYWVNDQNSEFLCECGNKTTFYKNWLDGYRKSCSPKCAQSQDSTKERRKKTNLDKWGVDNVAKSEEIKKRQERTNLERWGFKSSFQNETVRSRWHQNVKIKWGVDHPFQLKSVQEKSMATSLQKWGTPHFVQSTHYKERLFEMGFSDKLRYIYLNKHIEKYRNLDLDFIKIDGRILDIHSNSCGHTFSIHYDSLKRRIENGYEYCTLCNPINTGQSGEEKKLISWISGLGFDIIEGDRSLGFELDILIPEYKLAIEFNGLYWHSELYKESGYHLNKTEQCSRVGIKLIHIWEDDWMFKQDIIKSIIMNRLGVSSNKIWARKCQIRLVKPSEKSIFLESNHIQGDCVSSVNIGLYFNNDLVSLMTFGKRSINSKPDFELLRFCNLIGFNVIGGASKLLNYFITNWEFELMTSYADISQFSGDLYNKLGFDWVHKSSPNYWWVINGVRHHRFNWNKKRLVKEGFDSNMTEVEIMYSRGYFRIFGCGQDKYVLKK